MDEQETDTAVSAATREAPGGWLPEEHNRDCECKPCETRRRPIPADRKATYTIR